MTTIPSQKTIKKIKFSIFPPEMVRKMSATKVFVPDTYDDDGYPIEGGLVDTRLGVVDPGLRCKTCGGRVRNCSGHFGHIDLVRPVVHVEFAKQILKSLRHTCPHCYTYFDKPAKPKKVKSKKKKKEVTTEETKEEIKTGVTGNSVLTESAPTEKKEETKPKKKPTVKICPNCDGKLATIKIVKPTTFQADGKNILPSEIRDWLSSLADSDIKQLGFDPLYSRPEWMIVTALLVPPVSTRPSITLETGERSEDDLTHKLVDIIRINQKLEANISAGAPQLIIEDLWELLQYHITTFFNNETTNIPPARHRSGRPLKTLAQRLKGKEGRFRYNLSGKRVNFSARTVVSPDPRIRITDVGVPPRIAKELTLPVYVTEWNVDYCKDLILGKQKESAKYVIRIDGRKLRVTETNMEEIAKELKVGSVIERESMDGDIVLFNRQPSLHRMSMMGHEIRVLNGKTFRVNPMVIPPYNADFDGDEMNLHMMQNAEAKSEARYLSSVDRQILSPRHGHAIIKPQEDYVSGIYFLTNDKAKFTRSEVLNLLYLVNQDLGDLPKPDLKNGEYSGRLMFSQLLPKSFNFKSKSKTKKTVIITNSVLTKGTLDGKTITEIIEQMFLDYGVDITREFLNSVGVLSLEVISMMGLSVSLKDYTLSDQAVKKVNSINSKMEREIDNLILQYRNKTLERFPGQSLKETLESTIMKTASNIRSVIDEVVKEDLGSENPSLIMANIGSRGSLLNVVQMSTVVAQQAVRNKRPSRGYHKRALSCFQKGDLGAKARGFVFSSFRKGLTAYEFFLHAMGGRESLVNTAIRTARSGYMQRRLINALQDLVVTDDYTVRDSGERLVQFIYGGDKKDPTYAGDTEMVDTAKQDDVDTA